MIGSALCRNWPLIQRLASGHGLTLLTRYTSDESDVFAIADVIALDCREHGAAGARELVRMMREATGTPIVVLDGGLSHAEVATLVHAGAQDYFSEPFNVPVIAERLEYLAQTRRSDRTRDGGNAP